VFETVKSAKTYLRSLPEIKDLFIPASPFLSLLLEIAFNKLLQESFYFCHQQHLASALHPPFFVVDCFLVLRDGKKKKGTVLSSLGPFFSKKALATEIITLFKWRPINR
jgi:hypothetical protein